ncbi:hypothetical protein ACLB2K_070298 [Fragaria x ananassa]
MYIKEVTLDGFKSYATRTVVPGFDRFFNAITGLNGSGKSNILDSICFVLGITNLPQVRAANLQERVYKQGQAGITKATVSIVFDNSDRARSPLGYEAHSELTVTRQIQVQVQNLFHSVQLNVNNPHFLIMQGRITTVLNMKPPEILSMLEEAAGTRMYETKKEAALNTLEKKQSKVDEINKLLDHEILPALDKLRRERTQYMQWANGNADLDRLKRFCIAYEYVQAERIRDSAVCEVEQVKAKISEVDDDTRKMQATIKEMETQVSKLTAEKEASMGGEVKTLSNQVDALSQDVVREVSILDNMKDNLDIENENARKTASNIEDMKQSLKDRDCALRNAEEGAAALKKRAEELSHSLNEYETQYQDVIAGKNSGNEDKCLEYQLGDAKRAVGSAETELEQLKTKIRHCEKELKEKSSQLMSKREEAVAVESELKARKTDVENVKLALESLPYKEGQMEALQKDRSSELECVQKLKDEMRNLSGHLGNVDFSYRDPVNNFDRSKVKGVVAKLIKVKDSSTMTALEVTAGGKLFNVVVDTESTGKQLLQNGNLRRRVTIIPLNKIQAHTVPPRVQNAAAKLVGKENAELALSLVGYDEQLRIREIQPLRKKFMELKQQLELKSYDLKLFQGRAEQNEHHKLGKLVKRIELELQEAHTAAKEKKLLHEDCVNKVSFLEKSTKEHDNDREGRLKDLEKKIKETKALLQSASKDLKMFYFTMVNDPFLVKPLCSIVVRVTFGKVQVTYISRLFATGASIHSYLIYTHCTVCIIHLKKKGLLDFGFRYPLIHYSWNQIDLQQESLA